MNEKITTSELAELLAEKMQMTNEESSIFVKQIFVLVFEVLQTDKYLKIKGFGTFKLISINDRESVDVNTGERILIEGYDKISFTPEAALRDLVNKPFAHFDTVVLNEGVEFDEEEISEDIVEERAEIIVVSEKKSAKISLKTQEEKENLKKLPSQIDIQEKILPEEENILDQKRKEPEERKEILISKEEIVVEKIIETEEISQQETIEKTSTELKESFLSEVEEDTDGNQEQLLLVPEKEEISALEGEDIKMLNENVLSQKEEVSDGEEIVFETKENEIGNQFEDLNKQSENEASLVYGQLEDTPPIVVVRKNYMIPFYICLSFLLILVVSIAVIFSTSPQWFKDLLHFDGQTITIVTIDSEKVIKKPETKIQKKIEKQVVLPKTPKEEKSSSTKKSVEKHTENTLWITETHVNPNDFKIVGTLTEVTLQSGNSLARLSKQYYGTKDLWTLIVNYNKDIIKDPDHIPIGSSLKIPKLEKK